MPRLALTRKVNEVIVIGTGVDSVFVTVTQINRNGSVRISIDAPQHVLVDRLEIRMAREAEAKADEAGETAMTKTERRRVTDDGLPRDAKEWSVEMWAIFHRHIEAAKREMREAYECGKNRTAEGPEATPVQ